MKRDINYNIIRKEDIIFQGPPCILERTCHDIFAPGACQDYK